MARVKRGVCPPFDCDHGNGYNREVECTCTKCPKNCNSCAYKDWTVHCTECKPTYVIGEDGACISKPPDVNYNTCIAIGEEGTCIQCKPGY